jgi:hypothetical protein
MEETDSLDPKIRDASKAKRKLVADLLASERHLRSKRDLIEKVMEQHMPTLSAGQDVQIAFADFWNVERLGAIDDICEAERIDPLLLSDKCEQVSVCPNPLMSVCTELTPLSESSGTVELEILSCVEVALRVEMAAN